MIKKNCPACIYNSVCDSRKRDGTITDCCIPEAPLRERQRYAFRQGDIDLYIAVTQDYCRKARAESTYWKNQKYR